MKKLICKSCEQYEKDPGRCSLGRILPTKKNQCDKFQPGKKHGGSRSGAGRPKLATKKQIRSYALSPDLIDSINEYARQYELSISVAVENLIKRGLEL